VTGHGEVALRRVAILDANYHIECSSDFAFSDRLPIEIENKVRSLTMSWGADERNYPERRCVLSVGLFMRVFLLLGTETYRVGFTLEPYYELTGRLS
jgi:hypothetical protein